MADLKQDDKIWASSYQIGPGETRVRRFFINPSVALSFIFGCGVNEGVASRAHGQRLVDSAPWWMQLCITDSSISI